VVEAPEHTVSRDGVVPPDAVDGQNGEVWLDFGGGCDGMDDGFRACSCGKCKLVSAAGCVDGGSKMLRQAPGKDSAEHIADNDSTDAAIGLLSATTQSSPMALDMEDGTSAAASWDTTRTNFCVLSSSSSTRRSVSGSTVASSPKGAGESGCWEGEPVGRVELQEVWVNGLVL